MGKGAEKGVLYPVQMVPGAREALQYMKSRGHTLLLYSHRANRARRIDPMLDPLTRIGVPPIHPFNPQLAEAQYRQLFQFCEAMLPGFFDAIDDGLQGKADTDLNIDNNTIHFRNWKQTVAELNKEKGF